MWQNLMHGQCRWGFLAVVLFKRSAVCGADFSDPFQRFHAEEVEALTHDIACGQAKGKAVPLLLGPEDLALGVEFRERRGESHNIRAEPVGGEV